MKWRESSLGKGGSKGRRIKRRNRGFSQRGITRTEKRNKGTGKNWRE